MLKKILAGTGVAVIGIGLLAATMTGAQSTSSGSAASSTPWWKAMSVELNRFGRGRLSGTIASVSGTTIGVNSWGGTWNIDISSARLIGASGGNPTILASQLQVGDFVVANGTAGTSGWTFAATLFRDMSLVQATTAWGVISNPTSTGFAFTRNVTGVVYQVIFAPGVNIFVNGQTATAADLMSGMKARVRGSINNNTMTIVADEVRASTPLTNITGTIANPTVANFILTTSGGTAYTVNLTSTTKIYVNGRLATAVDLVAGMTARVRGIVNSATQIISASAVQSFTSGGPWSQHASSTGGNTSSSRY